MPRIDHLPVDDYKDKIIETVESSQVTLIVAQTGSGKTTRIPQFIASKERRLIMTQPRRVATWSISKRIAYETGTTIGNEIGYIMRYDTKISAKTFITLCTDGVMLNKLTTDKELSEYTYIIIDEFQERTSFTDISIALIKNALRLRKDLKLVITSATLDSSILLDYFAEFQPKLLDIPGRTFPIEIVYLQNSTPNYIKTIKNLLKSILIETNDGNVLVFLPSVYDINLLHNYYTTEQNNFGFKSLRLHSSLQFEEQSLIFQEHDQRCVIFSTNVAEAAVTVPNVSIVIDTGLAKTSSFDPLINAHQLIITPISKASAQQRAGRAGRVRDGTVYRLYTEKEFESLDAFLAPEIQRMPLNNPLCYVFNCGFNPYTFMWVTKPSDEAIRAATKFFLKMELIDKSGNLTELGRKLTSIPLDITQSLSIYRGAEYNCSSAILKIYSCMTTSVSFSNDKKIYDRISQIAIAGSDHLTLLNIFNGFVTAGNRKDFCNSLKLNYDSLINAVICYDRVIEYLTPILPQQKGNYDPLDILKVLAETHITQRATLKDGVYVSGNLATIPAKTSVFNVNSLLIGSAPKTIFYESITYDKSYIIETVSKIV